MAKAANERPLERIVMRPAGDDDCAYFIVQESTLEHMLRQAKSAYDNHGPSSLAGPIIADLEIILAGRKVTPDCGA